MIAAMDATGPFPALLRRWRTARGLSQLRLASAAAVSARHLSFLESGRARPSRDMVLRLSATLGVPMREQNALLTAAGFAEVFHDRGLGEAMDPRIQHVLSRMLSQQEPYPLVVMSRHYDLLMTNAAAARLIAALVGERRLGQLGSRNLLKLVFDPAALRPHIDDWPQVARALLLGVQRKLLHDPSDTGLRELLSALCSYQGVPDDWRTPDLSRSLEPTLQVRLRLGDELLSFVTVLTVFNAPQDLTLAELQIESYFPLDAATERACQQLAGVPISARSSRSR
jgi:transcriptional regulator with XRE-family HTH domain